MYPSMFTFKFIANFSLIVAKCTYIVLYKASQDKFTVIVEKINTLEKPGVFFQKNNNNNALRARFILSKSHKKEN